MKTISKLATILSITSFTLLLSSSIVRAIAVEEVANPRQANGGWVTDMADILSSQTELQLNEIINDLESINGTEIAIVTIPDTSPSITPKALATELFNYWEIGKADVDNGVLFLISIGDRRVEIETGYGVEAVLSNAEVRQIIDTKITPEFKQDNYDRGTLAGTKALSDRLRNEFNFGSLKTNDKQLNYRIISDSKLHSLDVSKLKAIFDALSVWFVISMVIISWLIYLSPKNKKPQSTKHTKKLKNPSNSITYYNSGSCHNHSSSSGGYSGGSFGGGSSGGGGCGGGW